MVEEARRREEDALSLLREEIQAKAAENKSLQVGLLPSLRAERWRILTIYAPMIYTAPCIMFLMFNVVCGQIHYEGKWEGVGPWKWRVFWVM
jgi:hypothetical protein